MNRPPYVPAKRRFNGQQPRQGCFLLVSDVFVPASTPTIAAYRCSSAVANHASTQTGNMSDYYALTSNRIRSSAQRWRTNSRSSLHCIYPIADATWNGRPAPSAHKPRHSRAPKRCQSEIPRLVAVRGNFTLKTKTGLRCGAVS